MTDTRGVVESATATGIEAGPRRPEGDTLPPDAAATIASRPCASTACRALTIRLTRATRSRSASVFTTPSEGSRSSPTAAPGVAWAAAADSRQSALRSAGHELEPNRPREVEHLVDDAIEPRDLLVDVGGGFAQRRRCRRPGCRSVCSAALMIISGLRTSCAMTVERRPSDDSRSFCAISRWKRAIESVSVLNVVASRRASSSSHRRPRRTILRVRSPVAATSRIASVMAASGRVMVRATAKLRSVASSTATTAVTASSVWIARRKRKCSVRDRRISATGPAPCTGGMPCRRNKRQRQHDVVVGPERDVLRSIGAEDEPASAGLVFGRKRRGQNLAVHARTRSRCP